MGRRSPYIAPPAEAPVRMPYSRSKKWDYDIENNWKIDPSNAMGEYKPYFDKLMSMMQGIDTDAGLGFYDDPGWKKYGGELENRFYNPETSTEMGLLTDQFTGMRNRGNQELEDRFAGWGRGSGAREASRSALGRDQMKTEADTKRQSLIDIMKGASGDLGNWYGMDINNVFEAGKQRELANAGLNRDLFAMYPGMLGGLADMLKFSAGDERAAQQATYANLLGLEGRENAFKQQSYNDWGSYWKEINERSRAGARSRDIGGGTGGQPTTGRTWGGRAITEPRRRLL